MNAEAKNVRVNIASYYVDISKPAMLFFRENFELINSLLPKNVESISSSNDSEKPDTLIVTGHTKNLKEVEIKNLINRLFENIG